MKLIQSLENRNQPKRSKSFDQMHTVNVKNVKNNLQKLFHLTKKLSSQNKRNTIKQFSKQLQNWKLK